MKETHYRNATRGRVIGERLVWAALLLIAAPLVASAQVRGEKRAMGYAFVAPGGTAGDGSAFTVHYGGGGEALVFRGLGLGVELGSVAPISIDAGNVGIFSTNLSYNFGERGGSKRAVPFVTSGYSRRFGYEQEVSGVNVGAGLHYWATDHLGVRLEFRDHHFSRGVLNFYGVRLGVAFR